MSEEFERWRYFSTSSGNVARWQTTTKDGRVALACIFRWKPSDADRKEFEAHLYAEMNLPSLAATLAGEGVAGRARQSDQLRRFLKSGELPPDIIKE